MTFDPDDLDELAIAAQTALREGNADHAAELFRQLVARWTVVEGPDGESVLNWRGFVAQSLIAGRRYTAAEEVLQQLLDDRARVLGVNHPSVLVARGNLAKAVSFGGRPDEALLIADRLLVDRVRMLGADDEATLSTRGIIAEIHLQAGRPDEAAAIYEALLADRVRVLGDNHHQTLITADNLRLARSYIDDPAAVIPEMLYRARSLSIDFGDDAPETLAAYAQAAEVMIRVGRHAEALPILDSVIEWRRETLGADDSRTCAAIRIRARGLAKAGRLEEAHADLQALVTRVSTRSREEEPDNALVFMDALSITLQLCDRALMPSKRRPLVTEAEDLMGHLARVVAGLEPDSPTRTISDEYAERVRRLR
jgi:tetratricopeptide (TPR) repeat protein